MKVPVCEPSIGKQELKNVSECVKSGWISGYKGKYIDEFEQRFAKYCGAKYGVTTTSCATALLLAMETMGIGKGDEVITADFTMLATVAAIIRAKAKPVLVDALPDTWCIDPEKAVEKITPRTRAIMPVPIYGHPVDAKEMMRIALKYDLRVIEDAAEAIGAVYEGGHRVGAIFNATCFSFYINKLISTGEGGMVLTNSKEFADSMRRMKGYDTDPESRFIHQRLGFNYRMTNMQAAVGCAQMDRIDEFALRKRQIAELYKEQLKGIAELTLPVERKECVNAYWVYGILLPDKVDRDEFIGKLADMEVETRRFFYPMHKQPALIKMGLCTGKETEFPVSNYISERGIYLPNGVTLTDEQVGYVCDCIKELLNG